MIIIIIIIIIIRLRNSWMQEVATGMRETCELGMGRQGGVEKKLIYIRHRKMGKHTKSGYKKLLLFHAR